MAKETAPKSVLERTYTIPLRREFLKVANWRRTEKAVTAVREFIVKHMKSKDVKIGKALNEKLWQHGIKNPPHHIKVNAVKDDKGTVKVELFGVKEKAPKAKAKSVEQKVPEKETVVETTAKEVPEEKKAVQKEKKKSAKSKE